jgi:hypothetical protein
MSGEKRIMLDIVVIFDHGSGHESLHLSVYHPLNAPTGIDK